MRTAPTSTTSCKTSRPRPVAATWAWIPRRVASTSSRPSLGRCPIRPPPTPGAVRPSFRDRSCRWWWSTTRISLHRLVLLSTAMLTAAASRVASAQQYPHGTEPIGTVRQIYDGVLTPEMAVNTFRNIDRLFPTRTVAGSSRPLLLPRAAVSLTDVHFSDRGKQYDLESYLELNRIAAILILQDGRVKLERYRFGNTDRTRWMSMSIAKSITSTLVGAALKDGFIRSLSDSVTRY